MLVLSQPMFPSDRGSRKVAPGRYLVWRRLVVRGAFHAQRIECANPAHGYAAISRWEQALRAEAKALAQSQV